ncbi:formate--tetrahydrofolate ligase [Arthrobacter sp. Hiyo4]|nr:formate--tetrahydrofolate ligase [Arthrobacter sp. Hiyo4]
MSENKVPTDLEIAQKAAILPIGEVAERAGINADAVEPYGRYKAKIDPARLRLPVGKAAGKVVLVSAMSPPRPARESPPPRWVWPIRWHGRATTS